MSVELPPEEEEEVEQREPGQLVIANTNATARHITFCSTHSLNPGRHHQGQSTALTGEFTATFVNSSTVQDFDV
ncbi:unnamed protein product [Dibothriocephalus latus]|uniref:Uncharacterized protein n=1 Tax=Dibothriocephalus latus TaxID=60516 RepID=A0A3P7QF57_DIBLA|nr:unnamed protein product [Dibothriocephalus latus]